MLSMHLACLLQHILRYLTIVSFLYLNIYLYIGIFECLPEFRAALRVYVKKIEMNLSKYYT